MGKKFKKYSDEIRNTIIWNVIVPIIIVSILSYIGLFIIGNSLIENENVKVNNIVTRELDDNIKEYHKMINYLTIDEDLIRIINGNTKEHSTYEKLYQFVNKRSLKSDFYIYNSKGKLIIGNKGKDTSIQENNLFMWGIFNRMKENKEDIITMVNRGSNDIYGYGVLSMGKAIIVNNSIAGYIVFDLHEEDLFETIADKINSDIIITDKYNIVAAINNKYSDQLYKLKYSFRGKIGNEKIDGKNYYIYSNLVTDTNLYVYTITDMSFYKGGFIYGGLFLIFMFFVIFASMIIWSKKIAENKTVAIDEIINGINSVKEGNLDTKLFIETEDEFSIIAESYNEMLEDLKMLIEKNKEEIQLRMSSQIKELEAQFNPHFLYNTLETIRIMIKIDKEGANNIIIKLSSLLRYGINNEVHTVKLKDDILYINNYLDILKYRFQEKLKFYINIEEDTLELKVPKLLIQPIIENSIKYGFEGKNTLKIYINSYIKNNKVYIEIKDTGDGITKERMKYIKELLDKKNNDTINIGLYNVHKRIKLLYGEEYGLEIESIEGIGTIVKFLLPNN
ncbi:histidine kinase [Clostridium sp.]|uniref:sensor histidine kinase n=1 Tax=Clostridium sp. TaxID=1506 RepID=UPI002638A085|nr:histidine kinase [Clostridium sp.]